MTSNMYEEFDGIEGKRWNPVGGPCPHRDGCKDEEIYCYMKSIFKQELRRKQENRHCTHRYTGEPRLFEEELGRNPGTREGCNVFVCNCTDLFAEKIPFSFISTVLEHCNKYPQNTYLIQSKNPGRFIEHLDLMPPKTILATTIESDYTALKVGCQKAPNPMVRAVAMKRLRRTGTEHRLMVTIEPFFSANIAHFLRVLWGIRPDILYVGANTDPETIGSTPEPSMEEAEWLVHTVKRFPGVDIRLKRNLARITGKEKLVELKQAVEACRGRSAYPPTFVVHQKQDRFDVNIGRPGKWGNPFAIKDGYTREESIALHWGYILKQPDLLRSIRELRGKTLGCWCKPKACHGDTLAQLASLPDDTLEEMIEHAEAND